MKYLLLIVWIIFDLIKDCLFIGGSIYLAIWRHCSGWWVVLGIILSFSPTLYKCLAKEFNCKEA